MNNHKTLTAVALVALSTTLWAQDPTTPGALSEASSKLSKQLEESLSELSKLREGIAAEKVPLTTELNGLEGDLINVRLDFQQKSRMLETNTLDLTNLRDEIKSRESEVQYLEDLLGEYVRNFESRLHIAELQRHRDTLDAAKLALENQGLAAEQILAAQSEVLDASIARLEESLGGLVFQGSAVDPEGLVNEGTFVLIGPAAIFRSTSGQQIGTAEQRLGSLEPSIVAFLEEEDQGAAAELVEAGTGTFPFDATLGNAHRMDATQESFIEHVQKGGPVMIPIFAMAGAALLVALYKWIGLLLLRNPSRRQVDGLIAAVAAGDEDIAKERAKEMNGPVGEMLEVGTDHLNEPRALIEEAMYESVRRSKLKLQSFLPFIAICAASAPLLGLLGTVTGIINTFKLITVFGSGDVKSLSGGISEALITTKFGLIVAIPSLLLHAYLSRKARAVVGRMESAAVAFMNQVAKLPSQRRQASQATVTAGVQAVATPDPELVRDQVNEILSEILGPLAGDGAEPARARKEKAQAG